MEENNENTGPADYTPPDFEHDHNSEWEELSKIIWTENIKKKNGEPTLVMSVIGDSGTFVPKPWSKSVFHTALMEAAKSGGVSWIIYKGKTRGGVSSIVQEAYRSYEQMEDICQSNSEKNVHLISIADQTDTDIPGMFVHLETFIFKQDVSFFRKHLGLKMPVPIVIVALEGDLTTVEHIAEALKEGIPVVIIKGTGMAADLIIEYLENKLTLRRKATVLLGISFNTDSYKNLQRDLECIEDNRDLVSSFDIDSQDPLIFSNLVGEAVVNAWGVKNILNENDYVKNAHSNEPPVPQLVKEEVKTPDIPPPYLYDSSSGRNRKTTRSIFQGISTTFRNIISGKQSLPNKKEIESPGKDLRPYVLNSKFNTPTSLPLYFYISFQISQELSKEEDRVYIAKILLLEALKANRIDYVQVLLDKEITVENEKLSELYNEQVDRDCADRVCFDDFDENFLKSAEKLVRRLLGYKEYKENEQHCRTCTKVNPEKNKDDSEEVEEQISHILLWSIFANRPEIAEICWIRGNDHLLTALICTTILRKLSKKAGNIKEQTLCKELEDHAQLFEKRVLSLLDLMYETHPENSTKLIDEDANVWGIHTTPLTFAHENYIYDVVAHPCSQKNLNYVWYNTLTPDIKPFFKYFWMEYRVPYLCTRLETQVFRQKTGNIFHTAIRQSMCSGKFLMAPLTKYIINYFFYLVMLVMYSAFVLTSINDPNYKRDIARVFEYYVYFWGLGDLLNEILNCYGGLETKGKSHRSLYSRIKRYFYDFWNIVDFVSYALLISALFLRHMRQSTEYRMSRRLFSLSLLVMYLRFLEVFLMFRRLGPTLIMIKEMLKDLLHFLVLAVFAVIGIGIYYHANLWPDHTDNIIFGHGDWTDWRIWKILYYPYWQLYGELFNDFLEGKDQDDCTNNTAIWLSDPSVERCPQEEWSVIAVSAVYMLFSNLLLVNLVIAMFSYTFERVQDNAEKLWRFERYTVITDYERRIPSPFNVVILPIILIYKWIRLCCNRCDSNTDSQKEKNKDLSKFERIIACKLTDKN